MTNDLLSRVLDAHGGLARWNAFHTLTAHLNARGPTFGRKGWPSLFTDVTFTIDTQRQHVTITPFVAADKRSVFDVGPPERFSIERAGGALVDRRDDPRSSFVPRANPDDTMGRDSHLAISSATPPGTT